MPRGPRGEKRAADVIGAAVKVMKIATEEIEEDTAIDSTSIRDAASIARKGGKARAKILTPEERTEIARRAAQAADISIGFEAVELFMTPDMTEPQLSSFHLKAHAVIIMVNPD